MLGVVVGAHGDRRYGDASASGGPARAALAALRARAAPGDTFLALAPAETALFLNENRALPLRFNLSPEGGPLQPRTESWLRTLPAGGTRVWLCQEHAPYADPNNAIEVALDQRGYKASNEWFGEARLVSYGFAPEDAPRRSLGLLFGEEIWLDGY